MQSVTELKLPVVPILDPAMWADPLPFIARARKEHSWLGRTDTGHILVHEYQAIKDLSYMDDKFRPSMMEISEFMGGKGGAAAEFFDNTMLARQPPEHTRLRNSVAASFTPRNINRYRDLMRKVISDLLDEWAPKGAFDFALFAAFFPITVLFGLVGTSPEPIPRIRKWLETQGMIANLQREMLAELNDAISNLWQFVDGVVAERRENRKGDEEDVLNSLIAAKDSGQLSDQELSIMLIFLFGAGYDTSKNMLTFIMHEMLKHPDLWSRCAEDRPFCDKVVEETFRYHSVSSLYRTATQDVVYRDILFPKGSQLFMPIQLSGRDPAAVADPDEFRPERPESGRHFAFGRGIHMCLGQHLARAQLQEGVHLIAQRVRNPRLAGEIAWRPFPGVWGIKTLPIAFEPAARRPEAASVGKSAAE
jgi:cytochrome P450